MNKQFYNNYVKFSLGFIILYYNYIKVYLQKWKIQLHIHLNITNLSEFYDLCYNNSNQSK